MRLIFFFFLATIYSIHGAQSIDIGTALVLLFKIIAIAVCEYINKYKQLNWLSNELTEQNGNVFGVLDDFR